MIKIFKLVTQKLNKNPINKTLKDKITKESSNKKELKTRQIVIKKKVPI
jgi:hypothetical protein